MTISEAREEAESYYREHPEAGYASYVPGVGLVSAAEIRAAANCGLSVEEYKRAQ